MTHLLFKAAGGCRLVRLRSTVRPVAKPLLEVAQWGTLSQKAAVEIKSHSLRGDNHDVNQWNGQPPVDVPRVTIKAMNSNLELDTAGDQQMGAGFTLENGAHNGF